MKALGHRILSSDDERSLAAKARERRWRMFLAVFPQYEQLRVIDVGGYPWNWSGRMMPAQLTVVNLDLEPGTWQTSGIRCIRGDATDLPDSLLDEGFDLVYSNSVIEHVGGYEMRRRFANMTNRLAPSHWVQTPNRWFPIEPHVLFPAQQFLPLPARAESRSRFLKEVRT